MTPPRIFAGRRRGVMARLIVLVLVQAVALAGAAVATRAAFGVLHAGTGLPVGVLVGLAASGIGAAWAQFRLNILAERMAQDYAGAVRAALFDHASRSRQSDLERRRLGYHLLRFTGDLSALGQWPGRGLPRIVQAGVLLPVAVAVLHWLQPAFGLVGLGLVLGIACISGPGIPGLFRAHATLRRRRARLAADMAERVPVAPRLAAIGRRRAELRHLSGRVGDVAAAAEDRRRSACRLALGPEAATSVAGCVILWFGANGAVSAASMAAALAALALIMRPLGNIATALNHAAAFRAAHRSLTKALARPITTASPGVMRIASSAINLEIDVPGRPQIRIAAGATANIPMLIYDRLVPVLIGTEPPGALCVRLNGVDVRDLSSGSLRRSVGHVTDAPLVLKGSLRKNLTLGLRKRPSDAVLASRVAAVGLTVVLDRLGGLDRSLAERGADLDADGRVALCLLRIAVQRPSIVLHDASPSVTSVAPSSGQFTVIHPSCAERDAA